MGYGNQTERSCCSKHAALDAAFRLELMAAVLSGLLAVGNQERALFARAVEEAEKQLATLKRLIEEN